MPSASEFKQLLEQARDRLNDIKGILDTKLEALRVRLDTLHTDVQQVNGTLVAGLGQLITLGAYTNQALHHNAEQNDNIFEAKSIVVNVKGNVRFVWQFDERSLKNALSGRKKDDIYSIIGNYPSVVKAEVVIKPPWLSKYPSSIDRIHVVQKLDQ